MAEQVLTENDVKVIIQDVMNSKMVTRNYCIERHEHIEKEIKGMKENIKEDVKEIKDDLSAQRRIHQRLLIGTLLAIIGTFLTVMIK